MSLTKEECLFALKSLKPANIYEFIAKGYLPFTEANSILTQLINEHFEVIKEKERLEKALNKACELIIEAVSQDCTIFDEVFEDEYIWRTELEEWKEWCFKNVD